MISFHTITTLIRGGISAKENIRRYPAERRARKSAIAQEQEDLAYQQNALRELIKTKNIPVDTVTITNALGYYVHNGADLIEAHRKYRALIESGSYLPASEKKCAKYGLRLRYSHDMLTEEDRLLLAERSTRKPANPALIAAGVTIASGGIAYLTFSSNQDIAESGAFLGAFICAIIFFVITVILIMRIFAKSGSAE